MIELPAMRAMLVGLTLCTIACGGEPATSTMPPQPTPTITPAPQQPERPKAGAFTVRQYRIYRAVVDDPIGVDDEDAVLRKVSREHGLSVDEVRRTAEMVMTTLSDNNWFGKPEAEIQHASDWRGR